MVGPGVLAGLSDDDPAGITTYSILGADYGYRLLWVAGAELLGGIPRWVSVPIAATAVSTLVLRGSFHRVEHILLMLSAVFVA